MIIIPGDKSVSGPRCAWSHVYGATGEDAWGALQPQIAQGGHREVCKLRVSIGNSGGAHRTQELGVLNYPPPLFPFSHVQIFPRGGNCSKVKMSGEKRETCRRQVSGGKE